MGGADAFSGYHPGVNFLYFTGVLSAAVALSHPGVQAISLVAALCYLLRLDRGGVPWGLLPMAGAAALINPLFSHRGITVLCYFPSGNPLTLESIVFGAGTGVMVAGVLLWFACLRRVMTADRVICLFGRAAPALSLLLSMTLSFLPRFRARFRAVLRAQTGIGRGVEGGMLHRVRRGAAVLSVTLTWSLENALDTADSMRSRGYGLPGRTSFDLYPVTHRDRTALLWLALWMGGTAVCAAAGGLSWRCYPAVSGGEGPALWLGLLCYGALAFTPILMDRKEERAWTRSKSGT